MPTACASIRRTAPTPPTATCATRIRACAWSPRARTATRPAPPTRSPMPANSSSNVAPQAPLTASTHHTTRARRRQRALPGFEHAHGRRERARRPDPRHPPDQRCPLPAHRTARQRRRRQHPHGRHPGRADGVDLFDLPARRPPLGAACRPDRHRHRLGLRHRAQCDHPRGQGAGAVRTVVKFPIDDRRVTGLLYPNIGQSSRNGFDWRQPIYINLAPNYDMTLEPRLMTKRGLMLNTEFRYLTPTGRGEFDFGYLPSDDLTSRDRDEELAEFIEEGYPLENRRKDDRGRFSFLGRQNINRTWQARANINWISDPRYIEDFNNNLDSISSYRVNSDLGVYGRGRHWDAGLMADYYQLADYTLSELRLPYYRLPRAYFNWEQSFGRWFTAGVNTEAARFQHIDGQARPGGTRLDLKPYVSMPLGGASWFVTPTLAWRYTGYRLDNQLAENLNPGNPEASPSRSTPISSLDAGLYFDRNIRFRGDDYVNTLEPRLFYLNVPYRNQDNLPIFATGRMTFSGGQLFRDNRFSGADRQTDANQLTMAVTSRLIRESDGREKLAVSLGQIQYFEDSRVGLSSGTPVLESGRSAWVADATYAVNDRWTIGASYQWDPKFGREDLASLRTRYLIGDDGIVNFSYRYRRDARNGEDLLKQADLSFLYPINPSWSLVGRYYYSIQDKQMLEGIAGVQWDSCCLAARLVARRYVRNRTGAMNDAIRLEIELKGLGSAGPDTASRLGRAILGYYREDLYLVPPAAVRSGADDDSPYDSPCRHHSADRKNTRLKPN